MFTEESQEPESFSENVHDVNELYIDPKEPKKKTSEQKQVIITGKGEKEEEKKKVYKPGPFAKFYQLNNGALDK